MYNFSISNVIAIVVKGNTKLKNILISRMTSWSKCIFITFYLSYVLEYISGIERDMAVIVGDFTEDILSTSEKKTKTYFIS